MEGSSSGVGYYDTHDLPFSEESSSRELKRRSLSLGKAQASRVAYLDPNEAQSIATLVRRLSSDTLLPKAKIEATAQVIPGASSDTESDEEMEFEVSEEFVNKFNNNLGSRKLYYIATNLLYQTRVLAGIEAGNPTESPYINIPAARINFALLASVKKKDIKMLAMNNLLYMLQQHDYSQNNAEGLIDLAIIVMKSMNPNLMQTETIPVQKKICQIYGLIAELIQIHYRFKDFNGVTTELKDHLIKTAKTLEDLNTQGDMTLHFYSLYALEGILRLKDNRKHLFMIGEVVYRTLLAAVSIFLTDGSAMTLNLDEAYKTVKKLPRGFKNSWYDQVLIFNRFLNYLTNESDTYTPRVDKLRILQCVVGESYTQLNWKYLFNALTAYADLAINSPDEETRMGALKGLQGGKFHGIKHFLKTHCFKITHDIRPTVFRAKAPVERNRNIDIQQYCGHLLFKIARTAEDANVRREAKTLLRRVADHESYSPELRAYVKDRIPKSKELRNKWIAEEGHYVWRKPSDPMKLTVKRMKRVSKEPQQPLAIQMIASPSGDASAQPLIIITNPYGTIAAPGMIAQNPEKTPSLRNPSKVLQRLAMCFGIRVQDLSDDFVFDGSIRPRTGEGLHINADGVVQIHDYLVKHSDIFRLDFSHVLWEDKALNNLKSIAEIETVHEIELDILITDEEAKGFAHALQKNKNMRFVLNNPHSCLLLGQTLTHMGQVEDGIYYLKKGLMPNEFDEVDSQLKTKIFKALGVAYELSGENRFAMLAYEKALEIDPTSFEVEEKMRTLQKRAKNSDEARLTGNQ